MLMLWLQYLKLHIDTLSEWYSVAPDCSDIN